ncbi:MAG: Cna B-type domain-containing protein [Butyrivibrio sp.]|nr:Cna B-type domain-containing protein [Butyrivibrio sp.]
MKNMKIKKRIINFILMFFVVAMMVPVTASARGEIDLSQPGDLTLGYHSQKTEGSDEIVPMVGDSINVYKIADVDRYGYYSIPEEYKHVFPITDLNKIKDQESWKTIYQSLGGYIYKNHIAPSATAVTDANGEAHFDDLELGIYFVGNLTTKKDKYLYAFSSFLVAVPGLDENDEWINPVYHVIGTVKCEITYEPDILTYEILKSWNDAGYENYRPTSIQVHIYCDGHEYAVVTLDSGNNWRYTWEYEEGHEWTFAETVSGNYAYTTSLTGNGTTYRLTNTVVPPETPDEPDEPGEPYTPDEPEPPTPEEPGIPDLPTVLGAIRDLPQVLGARRLPQTGQLWWPIPILVIAGVAFIIIGVRKNSKNL